MKTIFCYVVCAVSSSCILFGNEPSKLIPNTRVQKNDAQPFDADLYRRNVQVVSFDCDFLYWSVQEGALDYALKMNKSASQPCYALGEFQNATFGGDPGFRFAMRFFRAPNYWEIWGQYTRLTAAGKNHTKKPHENDRYVTGTWPQIFTDPVAYARSLVHVNYNLADVLVDRVFNPNPHLRLRFLGGATVVWLDQFWKIQYESVAKQNTIIANRWDFVGGGLRMGTLFDWYWFVDVYMTGGATFAAVLGSYHNHSYQRTNVEPVVDTPMRNTHFSDIRPSFTGQFLLGPSYQKNFSCGRVELFAGYELTAWWNLQEVYRSTLGAPSAAKETWINTGLLALQGLTTRLTLDL